MDVYGAGLQDRYVWQTFGELYVQQGRLCDNDDDVAPVLKRICIKDQLLYLWYKWRKRHGIKVSVLAVHLKYESPKTKSFHTM